MRRKLRKAESKQDTCLILFPIILSVIYLYLALNLADHWSIWPALFVITYGIMTFLFRKVFRFQIQFSYLGMGLLTYLVL